MSVLIYKVLILFCNLHAQGQHVTDFIPKFPLIVVLQDKYFISLNASCLSWKFHNKFYGAISR